MPDFAFSLIDNIANDALDPACVIAPLQRRTDHVARGLDRLIGQYRGKPRLDGLLTSYLLEVQALEDAIWTLRTLRTLDVATGESLRIIGRIIGRARGSLTEAEHRTALRAQIKVNRSNGKADELIEILRIMLTGSVAANTIDIRYRSLPPGYFEIQSRGDIGTMSADVAFELLDQARAGGFDFAFIFSVEPAAETFEFGDTANGATVYDSALGFGDTDNASLGGKFSDMRAT